MERLEREGVKDKLQTIQEMCSHGENVNNIWDEFRNTLHQCGADMIYKKGGRSKAATYSQQPDWWDEVCQRYKTRKYKLLNMFRRTNTD